VVGEAQNLVFPKAKNGPPFLSELTVHKAITAHIADNLLHPK
jgi:hypothetical protein